MTYIGKRNIEEDDQIQNIQSNHDIPSNMNNRYICNCIYKVTRIFMLP